ncbi:MAG TPA: lysylphosphatidylglycerol synthase transmembrane domain-containing protein [Acidimicrobiia bacterium]|nr:lysylphosphatidylglycerol synthase transmembrane domain-containing protein [Acidimicrobiia bacterium]
MASAVMLGLLLPRMHLPSLLPRDHHGDTVVYLLLGLLTTLAGIILSAWRWQRVLATFDTETRLPNLVNHYLAGQFVGNFLPSTIGGDVLRVSRLSTTRPDIANATAFASVVIERLTGWIVLPLLTLTGLLLRPSLLHLGVSRLALALSAGTLLLLAGILAAAASPRVAGRFAANEGWTRFIGAVHLGVVSLKRRPAAAAGLIGVATVYQLSPVLAAWFATRALGLHLPMMAILAFMPVVAIAQVLPVSLNGLGIREGALVVFLGPLGVSTGQAVAVGLIVYALTLAVSLLGAPAFAVGGRSRAVSI